MARSNRANGRAPARLTKTQWTQALKNVRAVVFDFDGVFTDNNVYVFEDGREAVRCSREDSMGLGLLKQLGMKLAIISTDKNPLVHRRAEKLNIKCFAPAEDKVRVLKEFMESEGTDLTKTLFLGNDINDLGCLQAAGLGVVVGDAHPAVRKHASFVLSKKGGAGAVRELCDWLWDVQAKTRKAGKKQ